MVLRAKAKTTHSRWHRATARASLVLLALAAGTLVGPLGASAQTSSEASRPDAPGEDGPGPLQADTGEWEVAGVPALNFDSDEGLGYGVLAEVYRYSADRERLPYLFTVQPTLQLSTRGRRDVTVFLDGPHLLPGWRITAFAGQERQTATPYYGPGNDSPYDEARDAEDGLDPYYYRFGRTRLRASIDLQRGIGDTRLRFLLGGGVSRVTLDLTPRDQGTTLLAEELTRTGSPVPEGWFNHLRAGLVWDSRDREIGTRRGTWAELLAQRVDEALGSETSYTRWTATYRSYLPVGDRLVLAQRVLLQDVTGDAPFHELQIVQTSFKQQEGLGGAKTLRGSPKNRHLGEGLFLWNAELRWRATDFQFAGRPFHVVLSAFLDSGRVWADGLVLGEILTDLHHGLGGGARLGMGESFVVALDVGHSAKATAPIYIGLGYLY